MAKPAILTVDDDPAVSQAITRDLRRQYGAEYQIVRPSRARRPSTCCGEFALRDRTVALIASDQRMPGMTGIEFLEQARPCAPDAKLVLLTAYADTDVAIKAINDIGLDYYLLKPWDPPEERLYPVLDDLLSDWREDHPDDAPGRPRRRAPLVGAEPRDQDVPRPQPRARTAGSTSSATRKPHQLQDARRRDRGRSAARARPRRRAAARAVDARPRRRARPAHDGASSRSTTSASSAAGRPASRPRCTARRRACRPS